MNRLIAFLVFICFGSLVYCQQINPMNGLLFSDEFTPRIDILISEESLDYILAEENNQSNELFPATFIFSNTEMADTIENVGFRLRGNTSRNADKKSFKVDINAFSPGRKYKGVQKINLNGQQNDPTVSRAKICSEIGYLLDIAMMRTNHVNLYINGDFFGVYTNVEHIDENFVKKRFGNNSGNLYKCLYPADLDYQGFDPESYKEEIYGRRKYELKTNTEADDYSDIAKFISVLNITSIDNLPCELENVFNVDRYLKSIVFDILTGNWDGPIYNKNNFYLYHDQRTGLIEYIPYDVDNTLGIDYFGINWATRNIYEWSKSGEDRPIYNRILSVPEYRNRFTYYMNQAISTFYSNTPITEIVDQVKANIESYISEDEYYTMDYGFEVSDFTDNFYNPIAYDHVQYGIIPFINTRRNAILSQLDIQDIAPIIRSLEHNYPYKDEDFQVSCEVEDDEEIMSVKVCYTFNGSSEICQDLENMFNGRYGTSITGFGEGGVLDFRIEAIDDGGQISSHPVCGYSSVIIEQSFAEGLVINEFLASNSSVNMDENGQFEDWIEIYNGGEESIFLGDKYLTDTMGIKDKWQIPAITIEPDEYIIFWADEDQEDGANHTNFKLDKEGEYIGLYEASQGALVLIDEVTFGLQTQDITFGRLPNGTGPFMELFPTPGATNQITSTSEINYDYKVFPNPANNIIRIEGEANVERIIIIDNQGKVLSTSSNVNQVSSDNIPSGIYYMKIYFADGKNVIEKLVIDK